MGIGAAMTGLRPVIEGMNMGFLLLAYNQISNNAGMLHYTSGGQYKVSIADIESTSALLQAVIVGCHEDGFCTVQSIYAHGLQLYHAEGVSGNVVHMHAFHASCEYRSCRAVGSKAKYMYHGSWKC